MNTKQKENAVRDFLDMIQHSWTYERMTDSEKGKLVSLFIYDDPCIKALTGSYKQRWKTCNAIFRAYLSGIGYTDWTWREEKSTSTPF